MAKLVKGFEGPTPRDWWRAFHTFWARLHRHHPGIPNEGGIASARGLEICITSTERNRCNLPNRWCHSDDILGDDTNIINKILASVRHEDNQHGLPPKMSLKGAEKLHHYSWRQTNQRFHLQHLCIKFPVSNTYKKLKINLTFSKMYLCFNGPQDSSRVTQKAIISSEYIDWAAADLSAIHLTNSAWVYRENRT